MSSACQRFMLFTGQLVLTLSTFEGDEAFPESSLGSCDKVYEQRVGDYDFTFFEGCKSSRATTLILRGANDYMVDEAERSVHDAICAVSRALEHDSLVPGGGCVETALCLHLEDFSRTMVCCLCRNIVRRCALCGLLCANIHE